MMPQRDAAPRFDAAARRPPQCPHHDRARPTAEARAWALLARAFRRRRFSTPADALPEFAAADDAFAALGDRRGQILAAVGHARCLWMPGRFQASLDALLPLRDEGLRCLHGDERALLLNGLAGCYSAFGRLLAAQLRRGDMACRYGGDEFCLLLPRTAAPAAQRKTVALLRQWRASRFALDGREVGGLTFSAGVADSGSPSIAEPVDLLRAADAAALRAKRSGRARVLIQVSGDPETA